MRERAQSRRLGEGAVRDKDAVSEVRMRSNVGEVAVSEGAVREAEKFEENTEEHSNQENSKVEKKDREEEAPG